MAGTSIKNKIILTVVSILLIVMVAVGIVHRLTDNFFLAQAYSTAFALGFGIFASSLFSGSLIRRLNLLNEAAGDIRLGDLTRNIAVVSQDEIRDLEEAFSGMVRDLRIMIAGIQAISAEARETHLRLMQATRKILVSSHEIDQSALSIAKSSEQQTLIAQKTSVTLEGGLASMNEVVAQSSQTIEKINDTRLRTEKGEVAAREALLNLERVLKQMAEYSKPIYRLSGKVEKIKTVMTVINEIAQKTDLLSLNASIEATRASELGKGFALVADEIRSMAENSKHSSLEIGNIVSDIMADNQHVLETLGKVQEGTNKGLEAIQEIVSVFGKMMSGVNESFMEVKQIGSATDKLVRQLTAIMAQFGELTQLAGENFLSTQKTTVATRNQKKDLKEMVDAMRSLNSLSGKMVENQQRFRLPER